MIGPIQILVVGFESNDRFRGEILKELDELRLRGTIRLLDLLFVMKDTNSEITAFEETDLSEEEEIEYGAMIKAMIGLGAGQGGDEAIASAVAMSDNDYGLTASIGTSAEVATFIGDTRAGHADAKSFAGIFHTVQASYGISLGGYKGEPLRTTGAYWVGGTIGLGPGFGGAKIDWDYKLMGVLNLEEKFGAAGKCMCYSIIAVMNL